MPKIPKVARFQRGILLCIVAQFLIPILYNSLPLAVRESSLVFVVWLAQIAVGIASAVYTYRLARELYGVGAAVVVALCALVPCFGLLALLIVNGRATALLKEHGVRVGLLGVSSAEIERLEAPERTR